MIVPASRALALATVAVMLAGCARSESAREADAAAAATIAQDRRDEADASRREAGLRAAGEKARAAAARDVEGWDAYQARRKAARETR